MNRTVLKWAGVVMMAIAAAGQAGNARACMPFGGDGGDTRARSGGGAVMSDGANVALYEWSHAHNAAVLVDRWFDPEASSFPPDPDEVDLTDQFFANTLSCGWNPNPPGRPPTLPMVSAIPGPGLGPLLFIRSTNTGSGAPAARGRWLPRVQVVRRVIEAPEARCSGVDANTLQLEALAIIRADEPGELCINCRYTIIYSGGERHDWYTDAAHGLPWPDGDRGCYRE